MNRDYAYLKAFTVHKIHTTNKWVFLSKWGHPKGLTIWSQMVSPMDCIQNKYAPQSRPSNKYWDSSSWRETEVLVQHSKRTEQSKNSSLTSVESAWLYTILQCQGEQYNVKQQTSIKIDQRLLQEYSHHYLLMLINRSELIFKDSSNTLFLVKFLILRTRLP